MLTLNYHYFLKHSFQLSLPAIAAFPPQSFNILLLFYSFLGYLQQYSMHGKLCLLKNADTNCHGLILLDFKFYHCLWNDTVLLIQIFFNKYLWLFSIRSWEHVGAENQMHTLFYITLYRGLERPWILISTEGPGSNPLPLPRHNLVSVELNVIHWFSTAWELASLTPTLFKGQLYFEVLPSF